MMVVGRVDLGGRLYLSAKAGNRGEGPLATARGSRPTGRRWTHPPRGSDPSDGHGCEDDRGVIPCMTSLPTAYDSVAARPSLVREPAWFFL